MATPTPGTTVVRLNGRVRIYAGFASANDAQALSPSLSAAGVAPTAAGFTASTGKHDRYGILEYGRLYPGFDGVAANGLKYGANLEIRHDISAPRRPGLGAIHPAALGQDPTRA